MGLESARVYKHILYRMMGRHGRSPMYGAFVYAMSTLFLFADQVGVAVVGGRGEGIKSSLLNRTFLLFYFLLYYC